MGWNFKKANPGLFPIDGEVLLRYHFLCPSSIQTEMPATDAQQTVGRHVMKYNISLTYISTFDSEVFLISSWFER